MTDNQPDEQILGRDGFVLAAQRIAELTQHLTGVVNNIQAVRASAEGQKPFDDFGYYAYGQKPLNDLGYFEAGETQLRAETA